MSGSITKIKADLALLKARLEQLRDGDSFSISLAAPFTKVSDDGGDWTVEGPVTAEVVDAQNEIILYQAAKSAMSEWRGNIRQMHSMDACGKALAVIPSDAKKQVVVRAMVSKGSPEVWQKISEGVLRGFSLAGTRLRSHVREDGVRITSALKISEVSFVDVPACPTAYFSVVKMSGGVPRITELLASEVEEKMECARASAVAVERVARVLAAGCRPLPSEVSAALKEVAKVAGTPAVGCDSTALRDFAVQGPEWGRQLQILAKGLEVSREDTDRKRIAAAAEFLLLQFASNARRASGQSVSASKLYEETAAVLAKTAAPSSLASAAEKQSYDKLSSSVFTLASMKKAESVEAREPLTLPELREMEEKLAKELSAWNEQRLPQNGPFGPAYEALTRSLMRVSSMRKRVEAKAILFGR